MNQNMTLDPGVDHRHPDPSDEFPPPPESPPPAGARSGQRGRRKRLALTAAAFVAVGAFAGVAGSQLMMDDASNPDPPLAAAASVDCTALWDHIRGLDVPEPSWEAVASSIGLFPRGEWISADGVSWEHRDGRVMVVAHPRSTDTAPAVCRPPAGTSDRSGS